MSWLVSAKQYIPTVIGEPFGGGYFAGYISHTANGQPTHALIVAPRATGATGTGYPTTTGLEFQNSPTSSPGATSDFDGVANTNALAALGIENFPAAKFCRDLSLGGYSDWYLPSQAELDIAYTNLKPSTTANSGSSLITNSYSVPFRNTAYTTSLPSITAVALFADPSGAERFASGVAGEASSHWSSSNPGTSVAQRLLFSNGAFGGLNKLTQINVRAFRRIAL